MAEATTTTQVEAFIPQIASDVRLAGDGIQIAFETERGGLHIYLSAHVMVPDGQVMRQGSMTMLREQLAGLAADWSETLSMWKKASS